ncbi:Baseplate J-like protein [Caprobacter fermentans]|uniref:Baseplate J-like protein n=1 Tax=Caproicibacter fermentans TaxID=2576756 RepID=A0A6N8HZ33_9FIRM|nr:baseplate J/gp47 family protein [Caproicibacter fermentans]MVB11114.1 Baseplate J-like protein [Caproicibacter fermentans]QNK39309.1 baseplate J/gp47 family protein [Caproicibacter fermentans]
MKKKFTDLAGYSPDDASDLGIRMKLLAGEIYSVETAADWLRRQTFAQTASGRELDYRAQERGIVRKEPVAAHGTLTFSRDSTIWFDLPIDSGIVCSTAGANPVRYVTTQAAVLKAGTLSVDVPAAAQESGCAGNTEAGTVSVLVTPPTAIQAVTNAAAFSGGEDRETDDALRSRLLQSSAAAGNGGNAAYYRDYALACDGVDSASVIPRANGAGTVALYLGGRGCAPSDGVVSRVSEGLNAEREICTKVTVAPAQTVAYNVTAKVTAKTGLASADVIAACKTAVQNYFYGLGVSEQVVPAALVAALFGTGMIGDCSLSTASSPVAANQLAVCGAVTVTVA